MLSLSDGVPHRSEGERNCAEASSQHFQLRCARRCFLRPIAWRPGPRLHAAWAMEFWERRQTARSAVSSVRTLAEGGVWGTCDVRRVVALQTSVHLAKRMHCTRGVACRDFVRDVRGSVREMRRKDVRGEAHSPGCWPLQGSQCLSRVRRAAVLLACPRSAVPSTHAALRDGLVDGSVGSRLILESSGAFRPRTA